MLRKLLAAGVLVGAAMEPAAAQNFNQFFGFGDSTIDSGWYRNATTGNPGFDIRLRAAVAAGGRGSPVGVGLMNSEVLAAFFGLTAIPANQPGGTNYAVSGARSDLVNGVGSGLFLGAVPVTTQINDYLASTNGVANRNALYLISAGGNDSAFTSSNISSGVTPAATAYLTTQADALAGGITKLRNAGARFIVVPNLFAGDPNSPFRFGTIFDDRLWGDLSTAGVNFVPADLRNLRIFIHNNLGAFGLTTDAPGNVSINTPSACRTPPGVTSAWGLICTPSTTPNAVTATLTSPTSQQTSLFSDDQHFSAAGQKIVADYIYSLIVAPSQISFLAEAPIKTRTAVVGAITNQIPLSFGTAGTFHGWVTGDVSSLKINNANGFPNDPGTPVAVTAGFDYRLSREWLVGVAFSGGTTKQSFSLGGDYRQDEFSASLYTAYRNDPFWADAILSWGTLHDDVNRQTPLGITMQANRGRTNGTNISFAAETGYNFLLPLGGAAPVSGMPLKAAPLAPLTITHGPVVGIILQQVRFDGFTEFNPRGAPTALAFGGQRRDSAVTEVGYQASATFGMWQPFVKAVWNHELADTDRVVFASLTSIAAPAFSMPAVDLGRDWGTGTVGTRVKLGPNTSAYAAFIAQVGQSDVVTYGGQVGLNVAFDWAPAPVIAKY